VTSSGWQIEILLRKISKCELRFIIFFASYIANLSGGTTGTDGKQDFGPRTEQKKWQKANFSAPSRT
jgi:hypothetical protein